MSKFQQVYSASRQALGEKTYFFIFLSFALFFFALFVFIPVATTPGNTLVFQLSIFRVQDYFLMILLALLVGLNFSMNIYAWRKSKRFDYVQRKQSANISQSAASGAAAGFGGVFASIVGTATCASCLAFLFGIVGLGIGSVAFVLKYQTFFLLGAIVLVLFSLYFTARKVNRHCASCE